MAYLLWCCRGFIGGVFLVSAASKLRSRADFRDFVLSLGAFRLVPGTATAAAAVVTAEASVPLLLLSGRAASAAGFALAVVLLIGFSGAIWWSRRRGNHPRCRCFGTATGPVGTRHLVRNAVLAACAAGGLLIALTSAPHPVGVGAALLGLATGGTLAVPVIRLDHLVELFVGRPGPDRVRAAAQRR